MKALAIIVPTMFVATSLFAAEPMLTSQSVSNDVRTITYTDTYQSSDSPAIGDPLGNSAMTAKHDAGPQLTQTLSYQENCTHEACRRAFFRWNSPTTWQQDRASGLSLGFNNQE